MKFRIINLHSYGGPDTNKYLTNLNKIFTSLTNKFNGRILLVGDFNRDFTIPDYYQKKNISNANVGEPFKTTEIYNEIQNNGFNLLTNDYFNNTYTSYHNRYNNSILNCNSSFEHLDWLFYNNVDLELEEVVVNPEYMKNCNIIYPNNEFPSDHALCIYKLKLKYDIASNFIPSFGGKKKLSKKQTVKRVKAKNGQIMYFYKGKRISKEKAFKLKNKKV